MKRKRKIVAAAIWLLPFLFVLVAPWLGKGGWLPRDAFMVIAILSSGPLAFTGLLSYLLLDRREDPEVVYVRASRRVGNMSKLAGLGVVAIGFLVMSDRFNYLLAEYLIGLGFFLFFGMILLALAAVAFRMMQPDSPEDGGARDAVIVSVIVLVLAYFFVPAMARSRVPPEHRANCQNNLRNLGLLGKMFANEDEGLFPELSARPGFLSMMNMAEGYRLPIMPEYLSDASVLFCPQSERWQAQREGKLADAPQNLLDDSSYVYLGYAVQDERELETFYECYRQRTAAGLPFNEDLAAPPGAGSGGGAKLLRLREGVEKVYVTEPASAAAIALAQSKIPFLIERLGNHEQDIVNVLYLDGHVEYFRFPGKWPATRRTFLIIKAIESLRVKTPGQ